MARILVAYYTRSGHTRALAEAVAQGAQSVSQAEVVVRPIDELEAKDLLDFDGIVMGSPVYYGSMAAELKKLLDDSVAFHGDLAGKVGGAFATSANIGGGNETTILSILQAMLIHGMIIQGDPAGDHYGPVGINKPDERAIKQGNKLGKNVAGLAVKLHG